MKRIIIFTYCFFGILNFILGQNFYVYGKMNLKDLSKFESILNNLIIENKNRPLKNVNFIIINNDVNEIKIPHKRLSPQNIKSALEEVYYSLLVDKPNINNFTTNLNKYKTKGAEITIYDRNNVPDKIKSKIKGNKYSNLNVAFNFFKQPIIFEITNIKSKYEITTNTKNIKIKYDEELTRIEKILYKIDNTKWNEVSNYYSDLDILIFQINKISSRPFNLHIALTTEDGDTSEIQTLNNLKFSNSKQNYYAEITGFTLETPSILRCKKLTGPNSGSRHYFIKLLVDKDFDINQININLKVTDKNGVDDFKLPLKELKMDELSVRLHNNNKLIVCLYINPRMWFGNLGICACSNYGTDAKFELWIDDNLDYLSYFEPNAINFEKIASSCQGFSDTDEEFKNLPLCDCK